MNNPAAPRLPLLSTAEAKRRAAQVGLLEPLAELNIFRVLLHRPKLAQCVSELLVTLLFRNKLDPRLRELIIMRIGWKTGAEYEWTQHWKVALGDLECCTREELLAVREWRRASPAVLGVVDRAVLAATDEVLDSGAISAEVRVCGGGGAAHLCCMLLREADQPFPFRNTSALSLASPTAHRCPCHCPRVTFCGRADLGNVRSAPAG